MSQGKQAKILTPHQEASILRYLKTTRYPDRDTVMFLLSIKAGLRVKEIASIEWRMVTDAAGATADVLALENKTTKGNKSGRTIPLHPSLQQALERLYATDTDYAHPTRYVIFSERGGGLSPQAVQQWFTRLYETLGLIGCTSHSGRRTFITRAAKKVAEAGGSLRDVQQLAGHSSLAMTQAYIEGDTHAKRTLIGMI